MSARKSSIGIAQFLHVRTKEIAYFLGFFWADGYVVKNKDTNSSVKRTEIRLEIADDDMQILKPTMDKLGTWNYTTRHRAGSRKKTCTASVSNAKLYNFLTDNDYTSKSQKSAGKILSRIPNELQHYFFRGLIDGDGHFNITKLRNNKNGSIKRSLIIASAYDQDWTYISNICYQLKIKHCIYKKINKTNKYSVVEINGANAKIFGEYIYQNRQEDKMGMQRKYNKFIQLLTIVDTASRKLIEDKKQKALELYAKGMSIIDIIKILSIASTTVRRFLKKVQAKTISKTKLEIVEIKKEKAMELYNKGINISEIIKSVPIASTTLRRFLKKQGESMTSKINPISYAVGG